MTSRPELGDKTRPSRRPAANRAPADHEHPILPSGRPSQHPPDPTPSCHDSVTMTCPTCGQPFTPTGRRKYCSNACRAAAYRQRRDAAGPVLAVPKAQPRRPITVYECDSCGARAVGHQICETCRSFMRRVGIGGLCPACDDPVAIVELVGDGVITMP